MNSLLRPNRLVAGDRIRHGTPAFRATNLALFAAGLATFGLLYCVQPLMPEFSRDFRVGAAVSALSLSLTTGVLAVAMLFAGGLSDAWGRKSMMVASLVLSGLLVLLSACASDWLQLLLLRSLLGLSLSGLPAVAMTYLSEEMHPDSVGLGMGLYISGSAIGGMGGRLLSGVLAGWFGWRAGIAAVGLLGLISALVFWRTLPPSRYFISAPLTARMLLGRFATTLRDPGLPWLFVEGFVLLGAFVAVYNYLGYRLLAPPYSLSQATVGLIFGVYLVGTFSSTWMGYLAGKLGRRKVLWTAFVLMLGGTALTLADSLWLTIGGLTILTFGFFGGHSIASSWVGRRAGSAKAQASSLYLFCYYMGSSIAGAAGGLFYAARGWHGVVLFVGALLLFGLLIAAGLYRLAPLVEPSITSGERTVA
ncbi:MAG TPA: MFS transporter [Dyella sp.]|uniref:MFS transporter n=1 Tax=Dyella sp. TaxID=1869338 RepID=UPI002F95142B